MGQSEGDKKKNTFVPPPYDGRSPMEWYLESERRPNFIKDAKQKEAVGYLEGLYNELMDFKHKRNSFLGRSLRSPDVPKGIYMWGGVGRGKSFLMDTFYNCLPYKRKRRVHFHAFLQEIHNRLKEYKHEADPMVRLTKEIAKEVRVLCFDEFHVSYIADAMIMQRLVQGLLDNGVVMVLTSNFEPDMLYYQGQNRYSFMPTIDLLKENMVVLNVDSGEDYRFRQLTGADVILHPNNEANSKRMEELFAKVSMGEPELPTDITVMARTMHAKKRTKSSIWFDFKELCYGPRSQRDYLELAQIYECFFVSDINKMSPQEKSEARRFTWLVDILYDCKVKLFCTSEAPIVELYTEGDFVNEFKRTESRLVEMASEEYLALPHSPNVGKDGKAGG